MRLRNVLVVTLTLVTGATDAIGFTRLGGVFTSVMTGNMVLLGVAVGRRTASLGVHTGVAFLGYVAGSLAGARVAGHVGTDSEVWPRSLTLALAFEWLLFAGTAVAWELAGARPQGDLALSLLGCNAIALGVQSSAVLRFGVSGLSTTYLTGTLTTVVAGLTHRTRMRGSGRSVAILVGLVVGAAVGAVLAVNTPVAAPAAQLAPLGLVVVVASVVYPRAAASRAQWEKEPADEVTPKIAAG